MKIASSTVPIPGAAGNRRLAPCSQKTMSFRALSTYDRKKAAGTAGRTSRAVLSTTKKKNEIRERQADLHMRHFFLKISMGILTYISSKNF